jgi:hypothetical protein
MQMKMQLQIDIDTDIDTGGRGMEIVEDKYLVPFLSSPRCLIPFRLSQAMVYSLSSKSSST